jgi:hypothetical protein
VDRSNGDLRARPDSEQWVAFVARSTVPELD